MAECISFTPEEFPDLTGMNTQQLRALLDDTRERIAALDQQEPDDMESEDYEVWGEQHEDLEDLEDEILDRLDELGGADD